MNNDNFVICALYKFVRLDDYQALQENLLLSLSKNNVRGTLLLAQEGINGTLAGQRAGIDAFFAYLRQDKRFADIVWKESYSLEQPFERSKVKLKQEIVSIGIRELDPLICVGQYVKPKDWNALIGADDVLVLDTRNEYEYKIGTFKNAVNPHINSFREFPDYVKKNLDLKKHKKVAMFCTGGIRCEKSSSLLLKMGFENIYHLAGGILKYFEAIPTEESLWQGECFVFDARVSVDQELQRGSYDLCHACRMPIKEEEKNSPKYSHGISCPYCYEESTQKNLARFMERRKQLELAKERGEVHTGGQVAAIRQKRRLAKYLAKEKCRRASNS